MVPPAQEQACNQGQCRYETCLRKQGEAHSMYAYEAGLVAAVAASGPYGWLYDKALSYRPGK